MNIGDWIHSSSGVGRIVKFDDGIPMIRAGVSDGGFHCYDARMATDRKIAAAARGEYFTDPEAI